MVLKQNVPVSTAFFRAISLFVQIGLFLLSAAIRKIIKGANSGRVLFDRKMLARKMVKDLNIWVTSYGTLPEGACIFLMKKRSYIDPVILNSYTSFVPILRHSKGHWASLKMLKNIAGIWHFGLDPNNRQLQQAIRNLLFSGQSLALFPEYSSRNSHSILEFNREVLEVAFENNIPVIPVSIEYKDPYIEQPEGGTLFGHMMRMATKPYTKVHLSFASPLSATNMEDFLDDSRDWIDMNICNFKHESSYIQQPVF